MSKDNAQRPCLSCQAGPSAAAIFPRPPGHSGKEPAPREGGQGQRDKQERKHRLRPPLPLLPPRLCRWVALS